MIGDPAIQRSPDVMPSWFPSAGGSSGRIRPSSAPEHRNERASTTSAPGAVTARTRNPATVGPATKEKARLPFRSELASTKRSRGTIVWKSDASETLKTTASAPAPKATAYNWAKVSASKAYASGTLTRSAARPRSQTIIVARRLPRRSTHAPA